MACCSASQSCLTSCNPIDCTTPGFPVLYYLPEFAQTHRPLSWWCHPTISSSVAPFSSCPQSFPASGSFPVSQFFASSGQSIGASASASSPSNDIQGWFLLGFTDLISLQSKGFSRVFRQSILKSYQNRQIKAVMCIVDPIPSVLRFYYLNARLTSYSKIAAPTPVITSAVQQLQ